MSTDKPMEDRGTWPPKLTHEMLPKWQSHKVVRAAKIQAVKGDLIRVVIPGATAIDENNIAEVTAAQNMFARYMPVPGDYYVVYDDGYASISPRAAFEEGYHKL